MSARTWRLTFEVGAPSALDAVAVLVDALDDDGKADQAGSDRIARALPAMVLAERVEPDARLDLIESALGAAMQLRDAFMGEAPTEPPPVDPAQHPEAVPVEGVTVRDEPIDRADFAAPGALKRGRRP